MVELTALSSRKGKTIATFFKNFMLDSIVQQGLLAKNVNRSFVDNELLFSTVK